MDKTKLNTDIHNKVLQSSEIFLKKDYDKSYNVVDALELIEEIRKNNLDNVTEIYIYEEGYGTTEKKLKDTVVHLITSTIAFEYSNENISYLQDIILAEDNKKSDIALDYFLKIGAYHEKFRNHVLKFVEGNINNFTKNKLNTTAFYMFKIYGKNNITANLFNLAKKLNDEKYPSQKNEKQSNSSSSHEQFEKNNIQKQLKKPWWKLW